MPKVIIPEKFICPITFQLMEDPVATCDGRLYERKSNNKLLTY